MIGSLGDNAVLTAHKCSYGNMVASVCLSVCPVRTLTFESLDPETLFMVFRYIFRVSGPHSYVKDQVKVEVTGTQNGIACMSKIKYAHLWVVRL